MLLRENLKYFQNERLNNNSFILSNKNKEAIIIDPSWNSGKIINFLEENKITPLGIILTHGHHDHIGDSQIIIDKYNIPMMFHENDQFLVNEIINDKSKHLTFNKELPKLLEQFNISFEFTPGHTPGSCVFKYEDIMFTGDFIFKDSIGRIDFPYSDKDKMRESIKNFFTKYTWELFIYPGHRDLSVMKELYKKYDFFLEQCK